MRLVYEYLGLVDITQASYLAGRRYKFRSQEWYFCGLLQPLWQTTWKGKKLK